MTGKLSQGDSLQFPDLGNYKRCVDVKHRDLTFPTLKVNVCDVVDLLLCMFLHVFVCGCTNALVIDTSHGNWLC